MILIMCLGKREKNERIEELLMWRSSVMIIMYLFS